MRESKWEEYTTTGHFKRNHPDKKNWVFFQTETGTKCEEQLCKPPEESRRSGSGQPHRDSLRDPAKPAEICWGNCSLRRAPWGGGTAREGRSSRGELVQAGCRPLFPGPLHLSGGGEGEVQDSGMNEDRWGWENVKSGWEEGGFGFVFCFSPSRSILLGNKLTFPKANLFCPWWYLVIALFLPPPTRFSSYFLTLSCWGGGGVREWLGMRLAASPRLTISLGNKSLTEILRKEKEYLRNRSANITCKQYVFYIYI